MTQSSYSSADLLLLNGKVLTVDQGDRVAQALALRDGKILAVGSDAELQPLVASATEVIDLDGRTVLPGLADCHAHLASDAGRGIDGIDCRDLYDPTIESVTDIVARFAGAAASAAPGRWLVGRGSPMQDCRLEEARFPTRAELDRATPLNPAYVTFGAHITVANTLALRASAISCDTPSPQGGTVVKDEITGEPTGLLRERAQYLLTKTQEASLSPDVLAEHILVELYKCASRGVTTIHDIVNTREEIQAYQLLAMDGRLPVRVHMLVRVIESHFSKQSLLDLGIVQGFGSQWLRIGGIKLSIDGGYTGKNGAFSLPLEVDGARNPGLIRISQEELDQTVASYHELGMRICTHAIGDAAVDMALEAYEKALGKLPRNQHRHRIEHMGNWAVRPEQIDRASHLGILAVPNPSFLYFFGDPSIDMLGTRMTQQGFVFRSIWDAGVPMTFGADAPGYFPIDPLRDLGIAVAHRTVSGKQINAREGLRMAEALRCQTANAAYAGFLERELGSIEVGKLADITVLGDDLLSFPPERFRELPVDMTIAGGRIVWRRAAAPVSSR